MDDRLADLTARGLLPPPLTGGACGLNLEAGVDYPSAYRGTLLGVAIGDALGRPAEGRSPTVITQRFGELRDFRPWRGWQSGPKGTITDDTQMTMCLARSIVSRGGLDPEDVARHFADWLDYGRGKGRACTEACLNLRAGMPWWQAGVPSAGNGAAMRASPIGLLHPRCPDGIRRDGALSAVITHADGMAVASAVAVGFLVAYLLHRSPGTLDRADLMRNLQVLLADMPDPGHRERRPGADDRRVRLTDRLAQVPDLLDLDRDQAFAYLHNGAFVLESLPAALWCFLKSPENAEEAVVLAANGGYDADTVAAMTGALSGAYLGDQAWPKRWLEDLEYAEELRELAEQQPTIGRPRTA
ncbi:MAG: ADP-ribosylglycohydrolase family protein [Gemmatimonadetes bacterium]|nr:ADP-ribosylglycohydrolase family protein [Gemmatimonadota bacterium]